MQDEVKVSQADERAVAEFHRQSFETLFATTDADIDAGINRAHTLLCQAFARHRHQAERETLARMEWRDIESAPYNTPVEIKVGSMTFLARLHPDASMSSLDESCDQWQAEINGEHPPCWSGGACWASNENEDMSLQPTAWRLPTPPEAAA